MLYLAPGNTPPLLGRWTDGAGKKASPSTYLAVAGMKTSYSYPGNWFSYWARKLLERVSIQKILGTTLVLAIFSLSIVSSETLAFIGNSKTFSIMPNKDIPEETTTKATFRLPLNNFVFSQGFSWSHWGIDLAAEEGEPVYPITEGVVLEAGESLFGYGKYILIDHQNGQRSLYAHLQKQEVGGGDYVVGQMIGRVGHTGWATGNHLHLEVYNEGLPLNPFEVLPEVLK